MFIFYFYEDINWCWYDRNFFFHVGWYHCVNFCMYYYIFWLTGCRISMIALHDYSCNTKSLLSYLSAVHQRYGLPIWLTEFACGDRNAKRPLHDQLSFMQEVVPELEKAAFVQRYAWMSARQRPGDYRALLANYHNGTAYVTELGKLYTSLWDQWNRSEKQ